MRSLFDRGPAAGMSSGGGAVIERTMLNRSSRQGGTMRGTGGMGFINRGASLGTGIDYGTFSGSGAGGARFYGEGVVRLKRSGTAAVPFLIQQGTNQLNLIQGGLVNNEPIYTWSGQWQDNGWIYVEVINGTLGLGAVNLTISLQTTQNTEFSQTPSLGGPPGQLKIPIYRMRTEGQTKQLIRLIGPNNITIYPVPSTWEYDGPTGCGLAPKIYYVWAVFS